MRVCVQGMHCASCDILVKNKLEEENNVIKVTADHITQEVEIEYNGELDKKDLQKKLSEYGYKITSLTKKDVMEEPLSKKITDATVIAMMLGLLFLVAQELHIVPQVGDSGNISLFAVFGVGLVASVSTCMATTGALYLATIGKLHSHESSWKERIVPAISFNAGRMIVYAVLGYINGLIGQVIAAELQMSTVMNIFVGAIMVLIGLDMLRILPMGKYIPESFMKKWFLKLESKLIKHPKKTAFFLGVITYWLPCGFTQSVQLYALSVADPVKSTLILFVFALGTLPALLAIGFVTSIMRSHYYQWFMKVVAVFVVLVGVAYFITILNQYGLNPVQLISRAMEKQEAVASIEQQDGKQVLRMTVDNSGYSPASFVVEQGKPVRWIINGKQVLGCQGLLQAPKIGVSRLLEKGENVVEFIPKEKGVIGFSCSSGSVAGVINVI